MLLVSDWTNAFHARDVNDDGSLSSIDALLGINELNTQSLPLNENGSLPDRNQHLDRPNFDVTGDGFLTPLDVLVVINGLNQQLVQPTIDVGLANDTGPDAQTNTDLLTRDPAITGSITELGGEVVRLTAEVDAGPRVDIELQAGFFSFRPLLATDGSQDGQHTVRITAFDESAVVNAKELTFVLDTTAPQPPLNLSLDTSSDTGVDQADEVTKQASVVIEGDSEDGTWVSVLVDAALGGTQQATTQWQIPVDGLPEGLLSVTATARDAAGNESGFSQPLLVTVDAQPPVPLFAEASSDVSDQLSVYFDAPVGTGADDINNYTLKIADGPQAGQEIGLASATATGAEVKFTTTQGLEVGRSYDLTVADAIQDIAGNSLSQSTTLSFQNLSSLVINRTSPQNGEDQVALTREVIVRFTEEVDPATVTPQSISVTSLGEAVAGRLVVSSTEKFATFFPDTPWAASSQIRVEIDGDSIRGRGGHLLDADLNGQPGGRHVVEFQTLPLTRIEGTHVFGTIYDAYTQQPIEGVTIRADGIPDLTATTDENGFFRLENTPAPVFFVHIDGTTAINTPAGVSYPNVGKPFHSQPGQEIQLNHHGEVFDIYLPQMATADVQTLSATEPTDVGFGPHGLNELATMFPDVDAAEWEKLQVTFFPNSAQDNAGNAATGATIIPVPPSRLPAPLPAGFDPKLVVSIQAAGASNFDVPAPITFPNLDNLPLGSRPTIWSFDHDRGEFVALGTGEVVDDGQGGTLIRSEPGVGILAPGWHFTSPDLYWIGKEKDPEGNGKIGVIDPVDTPVEAKLFVLRDKYGGDFGRDSYIFRFNPPPGPAELPRGEHDLSARTKIVRVASLTITNPTWFRLLYDLNPTLDEALGPDGKVRFVLRPGESPRTLSATLRTESDVVQRLRDAGQDHLLRNPALFASRITVEEKTIVFDPFNGINENVVFVKDKVPFILLDIGDDSSNGVLRFPNLNVKENFTQMGISFLGNLRGMNLTAEPVGFTSEETPPDVLRVGRILDRTITMEVQPKPDSTPGLYRARLQFKVTLNNAGGQPGLQTVTVGGIIPELQARLTPQRRIFIDRDDFIAKIAPHSSEPLADYVLFAMELEQILTSVMGQPPGPEAPIDLIETGCGTCRTAGDFRPRWFTGRSQENLARYGLADDTRFDTDMLASHLFKPSEDRQSFVVDHDVPHGRRRFVLDAAFNSSHQFTGGADIHMATHFDLLANLRSENSAIKDLAVTVAHEFFHLSGLVHSDHLGTSKRDLMQSKTQAPAQFSRITLSSIGFAMDRTVVFQSPRHEAITTNLLERYAKALTLDPNGEIFPSGRQVHASLKETLEREIPEVPELELTNLAGITFDNESFDLGEVGADGAGGDVLTQTLVLENYGLKPIEITSLGLQGAGTAFSMSGLTTGTRLEPLQRVEFEVAFDPTAQGEVTNTLQFTIQADEVDDPQQFDFEFHALGISQQPQAELTIDLDNNNLGGVEVGAASETQSLVTLTNLGRQDLVFTPSIVGGGTDFSLGGLSDQEQTLAQGESLSIPILFQPTDVGLRKAEIQLQTNDPSQPLWMQTVVGTGIPVGGVGPDDFDWGHDYIRLIDGPLINNVRSDSGGNFEVGVSTESDYTIQVFDPESGLVATFTSRSGISGGFGDVSMPLTFEASTARDDDGDGLPNDIEQAIGSNLAAVDTDLDGLDDFAEIFAGLDPLDGLVYPTGLIGSLNLPGSSRELVTVRGEEASMLGYVATGEHGLAIVDLTEPSNPVTLGLVDLEGTATDVAVDPTTRQAVLATGIGGVQVVDVSDAMRPQVVGRLASSGSRLEAADGIAYVAGGSTLTLLDLTTQEVLEDRVLSTANITDLAIERQFLYSMDSNLTLRIHEIVGIELLERGSITLPQGGGRLYVADGIAYVPVINSFFRGGFATVDVSDPDAPQLLSESDVPAPFVEVGTAVAANGSGLATLIGTPDLTNNHALVVLNVQDPSATNVQVATFALPSPPRAVTISSGMALVADDNGLQVVNFLPFDNLGVPPSVTISTPLVDIDDGLPGFQVVEGTTIPVQSLVTDDVQIQEVQLLVNNQVVQTDISFPWALSTVARAGDPGEAFTIQVRAVDTGGNESTSPIMTLDIVEDSQPPTIEAWTPADGATGTAGVQVSRIEFSEPIQASTLNSDTIRLTDALGNEIAATAIRLRTDDTRAQITFPALGLGTYLLTLDAAAITDRAGNPLGDVDITRQFTLEESDVLALYPNQLLTSPAPSLRVAVGDLNQDGLADIVSANGNHGTVSVFLSEPDQGFPSRVDLPVNVASAWAKDVYVRDVNQDQALDIIVLLNRNQVVTMLNDGSGVFGAPTSHPIASFSAVLMDFGDFNEDDKVDILVFAGGTSTILLGGGDGTFTRSDVALSGGRGVASGDFNGDGKLDVVTEGFRRYDYYEGNGDGTFAERVTTSLAFPTDPVFLTAGHFNDDNFLDFASTNRITFDTEVVNFFLGAGDGTFADPVTQEVPVVGDYMVAEDLNQDGISDLVVANGVDGSLSVVTSDGQGGFTTTKVPSASRVPSLALGDLNADGLLDVVAPDDRNPQLQIQLGIEGGQIAGSATTILGNLNDYLGISGVELVDISQDGIDDLVLLKPTLNTPSVTVLRGVGDGTFAGLQEFAIGASPTGLASGDLNNDGRMDLVTFSQGRDSATVLLADSNGNLTRSDFAAGDAPEKLAIGDLDGDGNQDLVFLIFVDDYLWLKGRGDGSFLAPQGIAHRPNIHALELADLNNDGRADVVSFEQSSSPDAQVVVQLAGENGALEPAMTFTVPRAASLSSTFRFGDVNSDGITDVVVHIGGTDTVSILLGAGDGTLGQRTDLNGLEDQIAIELLDADGDGNLDLISSTGETVYVARGLGNGTFEGQRRYRAGKLNVSTRFDRIFLMTGDLDGDGDTDIATLRTNTVQALLQGGRTGLGSGLRLAPPAHATEVVEPLSVATVQSVFEEATARWSAVGLPAEYGVPLSQIQVGITDLSGDSLAQVTPDVLWLDVDAAGHGWFVDSTFGLDEEFTSDGGRLKATSGPASDRVDLLTVVLHEIGHVLGLEHNHEESRPWDLMEEVLEVGERRLPSEELVELILQGRG